MIESGGDDGVAESIKSHHNVGGLPADMKMKLVEPLRLLFKDEVRRVGEELGMPERMVWRQPFPGPGLAIRIIGEVTRERLETLREADAILQEEMRRAGLYRELWQSFCVLPAIRSVGVQGDSRTYGYPIVDPRRHLRRRDDGRLGAAPVRPRRARLVADRERDPGRQPGRPRRHLEAACHDRVGMRAPAPRSPLVLAFAALPAGDRGRGATHEIKVISVTVSTVSHDIGPKGASKGDTIVYRDRLVNAAPQFGKKTGRRDRLRQRHDDLHRRPHGDLQRQGDRSLAARSRSPARSTRRPQGLVVPVTGGTGAYAHYKGTLLVGSGSKRVANTYRLTRPSGPVA